MTSLLLRLFGDVSDWFDVEWPRTGRMIRVEGRLTDTGYTLRAELPGVDPEKDVQVAVDYGVLTVRAERHEEQRGGSCSVRSTILV
ncbi:Hsp20/alpha crystallin family protein [Krasilnikovia sp. M28-CT-15]|uniref:Hsp20/alpha crystallin family protein n=1 Tax=Krasilnikovia sp. M28-CT-15 TaxID=3373540 RepID=UPI0038774D71